MKNIFTSKLTLIMAGFGAFLSLILSLLSKANALQLLLRMMLSTLIMSGIAILIQFLISKFIPQEHLDILLKGNTETTPLDTKTPVHHDTTPATATGGAIDYTDDSSLTAEELYKTSPEEDAIPDKPPTSPATASASQDSMDTIPDSPEMFSPNPEKEDSTKKAAEESSTQDDSFQATDFSESPRLQENASEHAKEEKAIPFDESAQSKPSAQIPDLAPMAPVAPADNSPQSVSFTVDNKKINADPKIIAKAIRTALSKD